ncbi:MAG: hypothetical protein L0Y56_06105 [Nitrospira sp.]|nr:hypothetical protein [Nitrospira sp.]
MPRYTKQRDRYSCGPIAIINALRWAGEPASYERLSRLQALCDTKPGEGTMHSPFDRALRMMSGSVFSVQRVYRPKLRAMERHLRKGGAIVINWQWRAGDITPRQMTDENFGKRWARHFALLVGINSRGRFQVINVYRAHKAFHTLSREAFKKEFLHQRSYPGYKGWFLGKID